MGAPTTRPRVVVDPDEADEWIEQTKAHFAEH